MATALETAQSRLTAYLAQEASLLSGGQEYTVSQRRRRSVELSEVRAAIKDLQAEIDRIQTAGTGRIYTVVPR